MSFTSIPNQPIIFNPTSEVQCEGCGTPYQQLVDFNDEIFFQVKTTPCEGSQLYKFGQSSSGWGAPVNGFSCSTAFGSGGFLALGYYMNFSYKQFQVTFTVTTLEQGSLSISMNGSSTYVITLAGTYTFYFNQPTIYGTSGVQLLFVGTWIGCLNVQSIKVNGLASVEQLKVAIVDAETLAPIEIINYLATIKDNKITVAFRLTDLALGVGCYRLAFADFCTNTCGQSYLYNGNLMATNGVVEGWSLGGDVPPVLTQGTATFNINVEEGLSTMTSILGSSLCEGLQYQVILTVQSRSNVIIYVVMGANQEVVIGTGFKAITIVAGAGADHLQIIVEQSGAGSGTAVLTGKITVQVFNEDIQWDNYTNVLSIGDYNDTCKYYKIEGCNAEDQFNLAFGGSSFLPAIRLEGRKFRAQYQTEVSNFRFASGNWSSTYVDREKKWTFNFGRLPEYVLDFLSTIFYYDNCYVNGDLYYPIDEEFPDVEYNDADDLGAISIDLALKKSKVRKTLCSNVDANCLPSILDNDEPFILTQDGQRITTEDSVNLYYEN